MPYVGSNHIHHLERVEMPTRTSADDMQAKITAILATARHPNTPLAEAETAMAMAWKLMQKYGIEESATRNSGANSASSDDIICEEINLVGLYRVRRGELLYQIAKSNCCAGYRDLAREGAVAYVFFGTASDIFNTRTIFATAEMLALRLMPYGSRSFRTAWWHGFTHGIIDTLHIANQEFVREYDHQHAAISLVDRSERAEREMTARINFGLRRTRGYASGSVQAFKDGKNAARTFSHGHNSVQSRSILALNK